MNLLDIATIIKEISVNLGMSVQLKIANDYRAGGFHYYPSHAVLNNNNKKNRPSWFPFFVIPLNGMRGPV